MARTVRPRIGDVQRRARLVARHHLRGDAPTVTDAVRAVVALHSSDPVTPYLAAWSRVTGFATADLDRELFDTRTLWRLHAMRRTLFVVPSHDAAVFDAAAGRAVARAERKRLEGWLAAAVGAEQLPGWLAQVEAATLAVLADGRERGTSELAVAVPELATELTVGSGRWTAKAPLSSRLLFLLALEGRIVRARPAGTWRSSQYRWAATAAWFERLPPRLDAALGRAELTRRYLASHGPATLNDLRWWTGWTVKQATAALADVDATVVDLDGGRQGFVLAGDLDAGQPERPQVALLPGLDPTPMGWKERGWYLGGHAEALFDRNGNAGPTVWVDGRAVGAWGQRRDGEVVCRLLEDVGAEAAAGVAGAAAALTVWLDGLVVSSRFRTPLERELSGT